MAGQSLTRALADPRASLTTIDGIDGPPRDVSIPPRTEERLRKWGRRTFRVLGAGPLGRLRRWQAALLIVTVFLASGVAAVYFGPATLLQTPPLQTTFLYDRDGLHVIGQISAEENRVVVPLAAIPTYVQEAFIATEDGRFWSHPGIDPIAIVRAMFANFGGKHEGASTITQQLVKNETVGGKRTLWRKINEAIIAIRLDRRYSKKQILAAYLNSIYLGHGAYGVEAASRLYFGHGVSKDSLAEAALLAGITSAPERFSPRLYPAAAKARRDHALDRMYAHRYITQAQHDAAAAEPIRLARPKPIPVLSPLFVDWVRGEILRRFGEDEVYRGGLRVRTSLDLTIQTAAEDAVAQVLDRPDDPSAAVVAIDTSTGEVRAMVGGRSPHPGDFNFATQAHRQAGSAFKPFVLTAALEDGIQLSKGYRAPASIRVRFDSGQVWPVSNYDRRGYGWLTLRNATAYSVNTVYAQVMRDVGPESVVDVAHALGFTSPLSPVPSLALGTSGVTPLEMASAYGAFDNDGSYLRPTGIGSVRDAEGKLLYEDGSSPANHAIPPSVAADVREALRGVVQHGTGYPMRIPGVNDLAGKTGTTEDHRDAWFVGFARGFAVAVWVGYPSGRPMEHVHGIKVVGASFPGQIFKRVMSALLDKYSPPGGDTSRSNYTHKAASPTSRPSASPSAQPSEEPSAQPTPTPKRRCILFCG